MQPPQIARIGFMMEQALGTMTATLASSFKAEGIDLPHSQYAVMRLIYSAEEPVCQVKIAQILKKDAAAIKRTLDILERKGMIVREAQNGRTNVISCTPKALELKNRIIETANTTLQRLFHGFDPEEVVTLHRLLAKIAHNED